MNKKYDEFYLEDESQEELNNLFDIPEDILEEYFDDYFDGLTPLF